MDLFDIACGLKLGSVKVKIYFKDSSKNCKFNIITLACCDNYDYLIPKDVSHFKYNVKRKILSLYYED